MTSIILASQVRDLLTPIDDPHNTDPESAAVLDAIDDAEADALLSLHHRKTHLTQASDDAFDPTWVGSNGPEEEDDEDDGDNDSTYGDPDTEDDGDYDEDDDEDSDAALLILLGEDFANNDHETGWETIDI